MESSGDDLQITSVGTLYRGQWDKKYWSSSRGKDRYPYPVGYHAVRIHAGNTYRMEIHEGLTGPIFVVTSADGESCTGQTPDITWENFQKKNCPRVKNWQGKRFSSKIDGVELFGFKNPFVQRLLRELMANVNGIAEKNIVSQSSCSRTPKLDDGISIQDSREHPNLLPYLGKRRITGKRSMRNRKSVESPAKEARVNSVKKTRRQDLLDGVVSSNFKQGYELCPTAKDSTTDHVISPKQGGLMGHDDSPLLCADNILNKSQFEKPLDAAREQRGCLLEPKGFDTEVVDLARYLNVCVPDTCDTTSDDVVSSPSKIQRRDLGTMQNGLASAGSLVATSISCVPGFQSRTNPEYLTNENKFGTSKYMNPQPEKILYHVPTNTLSKEKMSESKFDTSKSITPLPEEILYHVSCSPSETLLKEQIKDSLPEVGSSSGSSNANTEKIDLDLAGQELARSMMTFLLPRAVPLLENTYVRKTSRHRSRQNKSGPYCKSSGLISTEQNENDHLCDAKSEGRTAGKMLVQGPKAIFHDKLNVPRSSVGSGSQVFRVVPPVTGCITPQPITISSKDVTSIIPDSFEDDHCVSTIASKRSCSGSVVIDIAPSDKMKDNARPSRLPEANVDEIKKLSSFLYGSDECSREILPPDEHGKGEILLTGSVPANPDKYISLKEELTDDCIHETENCTDNIPFSDSFVMNTSYRQLNDGCIYNAEEEIVACKFMPQYYPLKGDESFVKDSPSSNNLVDKEIPQTSIVLSHTICSNFTGKEQNCIPDEQADASFKDNHDKEVAAPYRRRISTTDEVEANDLQRNLKTLEVILASEDTRFCGSNASKNRELTKNLTTEMKYPNFTDPSFSCVRKDCVDAANELSAPGRICIPFQEQVKDLSDDDIDHALGILPSSDMDTLMKSTCHIDSKDLSKAQLYRQSHSDAASHDKEKLTKEIGTSMELFGCYLHPYPILSIFLNPKDDSLQVSVLCGLGESSNRSLFIYMVPVQDNEGGCPSFLGYTSLLFPLLIGPTYGNIPFERSGLQFTPDGQSLVFLSSIKAPRCREQNIDCSCANCKPDSEENEVEIVHVKFGYVSSVVKFTSAEKLSCILVCEPNHLIAVEGSGKLHVWIMNFNWSANLEEFILPKFDDRPPTILELKRIPKSNSIIIGHNGFGDFGIWDISNRVLLARFSSPGSTTFRILPVNIFNWRSKDNLANLTGMEYIKEIAPVSDLCSKADKGLLLSLSGEDIAVSLLVSAALDSEAQLQGEKPNTSPSGWWRLALLVKNTVVMGSILDHRISAVSASDDYGIYGTFDGFLCKWQLSTGKNMANIHPFECGSVSSIAIDDRTGAIAVGGNNCKLLVYVRPQRSKKEVDPFS